MKRKTSILRRITIMSWLVAVISVAAFALCMIRFQRTSFQELLWKRGSRLAINWEDTMLDSMVDRGLTSLLLSCEDLLERNNDVSLVVVEFADGTGLVEFDEDGSGPGRQKRWMGPIRLDPGWTGQDGKYTQNEMDIPPPSMPKLPNLVAENMMIYSKSITQEGMGVGNLHIGMSLASAAQAEKTLYAAAGIVGGLILIGGVLGTWMFARNITKPLLSLQAFAYKVATGALNARASIDSGDEIGDLAHSINRMVEALEGNQLKLRDSVKTEAAAREKEILLREIHHRVKNNMQILTSLLRLQARRANSAQLRTVLQESESRIRSMGLLHEKLYQSESVSTIDMNGYLRSLTNELLRVNTPAGKKRDVKLSVNNINLGMDTALPCGLIATELVSNALKYAFPDHPEGIIWVSISLEQSGEFSLVVWDNGIGIPSGMDISKTESLGMRLVTMLTDQLNGTFQYSNNQGTRWEVKFRESQYKIRL